MIGRFVIDDKQAPIETFDAEHQGNQIWHLKTKSVVDRFRLFEFLPGKPCKMFYLPAGQEESGKIFNVCLIDGGLEFEVLTKLASMIDEAGSPQPV